MNFGYSHGRADLPSRRLTRRDTDTPRLPALPQNHMPAYPYKVTPELRRELRLSKTTLRDILAVCDPPPTPEVICELLRAWRNITPAQKAAWDDAATRENMRTGADPLRN